MGKKQDAEDLDRGFEALNDAHYLNDGDVVYFDDNTRRYYQVSPVEVASYGEMLRKDVNDAYSLWCAETSSEELPRGYNPETETAPAPKGRANRSSVSL